MLKVEVHKALQDSDVVHKWWLRHGLPDAITVYHPRCIVFSNALNQRCRNAHQTVPSSHGFLSPFAVRRIFLHSRI